MAGSIATFAHQIRYVTDTFLDLIDEINADFIFRRFLQEIIQANKHLHNSRLKQRMMCTSVGQNSILEQSITFEPRYENQLFSTSFDSFLFVWYVHKLPLN